jgi:hypothetical protein
MRVCRELPVRFLAAQVGAKSRKPKDIAKAYSSGLIKGDRPAVRKAVYDGCLTALRKKAH